MTPAQDEHLENIVRQARKDRATAESQGSSLLVDSFTNIMDEVERCRRADTDWFYDKLIRDFG